jgi:uncharacterized protein YecT (DUF1311 family)
MMRTIKACLIAFVPHRPFMQDAQTMSAAKIVRLILACIAALIITTLTHSGPSYGQTQSELNQQASDEFLKADQRLNAVFSSLIAKISAAGKASLRDAEKFRDQECAFETMGSVGGSVHPMVVSQCRSRLTNQRTKDLEGQLNCKEGDLSCGGHLGSLAELRDG